MDLLHQNASPAALPDSRARTDQPRCMEETRVELRQELDDWETSPLDGATMKWVVGGAGDGKTALLLTFADLCRRQKRSIGAFFASNRITDCSDGNRIIATLASQLMQALPSTAKYIDKALHDDPYLFSKAREVQMNALIIEPIKRIAMRTRLLSAITFGLKAYPTLIVIDGLDEITGKDVQTDIIKIIGNAMRNIRLPLRFLVASRPEPHIVDAINALRSQFPEERVSIMDLREDTLVHRDIRRYFNVKFEEIRAKDTYLPHDWPGENVVDQLVDKASGQFIYATTIMPYIMLQYRSPEERLAIIRGLLEKPPGDKPYQHLDELYSLIVRNANRRADMLRIMVLIIVINRLITTANVPPGPSTHLRSQQKLGDILGLRKGDVRRCLMDMHSVVNIGDDDRDVQIYHKSFPDFLLDPSRFNEFVIDVEDAHVCLFSYLIGTARHRDIILQVLGQVIIAESMPSDVDYFGTPANTTSSSRIASILGLERDVLIQAMAEIHVILAVGYEYQNIGIRPRSIIEFLLDRSKSRELFVDVDEARLTLLQAPIRCIFNAEGM